jgi:hypothetical protein
MGCGICKTHRPVPLAAGLTGSVAAPGCVLSGSSYFLLIQLSAEKRAKHAELAACANDALNFLKGDGAASYRKFVKNPSFGIPEGQDGEATNLVRTLV